MELIVIGGGCYGCYHTRQLLKAQRRGRIQARRILVVDHNPACRAREELAGEPLVEIVRADWASFLRDHLAVLAPETADRLIPAPFAPHLLCDWLADALATDLPGWSVAREPCELSFGLPYEVGDPVGNRFISAAGWVCPATCIEPARCPAIRGERAWELGEIVRAGAARAAEPFLDVALFTCRHYAFGIGAIPIQALLDARREVIQRARHEVMGPATRRHLLVGTVSACHGVLGQLALRAPSRSVASSGR